MSIGIQQSRRAKMNWITNSPPHGNGGLTADVMVLPVRIIMSPTCESRSLVGRNALSAAARIMEPARQCSTHLSKRVLHKLGRPPAVARVHLARPIQQAEAFELRAQRGEERVAALRLGIRELLGRGERGQKSGEGEVGAGELPAHEVTVRAPLGGEAPCGRLQLLERR